MRRASVCVLIASHVTVDRVARAKIIETHESRFRLLHRYPVRPVDPARAGRAGERPADHSAAEDRVSDCDNVLCNLQIGISYAPLATGGVVKWVNLARFLTCPGK